MTVRTKTPLIALLPVVAMLSACGGSDGTDASTAEAASSTSSSTSSLPQGSEPSNIDPAEFTTQVDNPYMPLTPGDRWVYVESSPGEPDSRVVVEVKQETKTIANGVEALVVNDTATVHGEPAEVTDDWYAQDSEGNVWYLGEDTAEYENGKVSSRHGSFEAGVGGAEAGVVMPADPAPGQTYRQEYLEGEAEDQGEILSTLVHAQVEAGFYPETLLTKETNPNEPKVTELKFYEKGVGLVLALDSSGGEAREQLLSFEPGS